MGEHATRRVSVLLFADDPLELSSICAAWHSDLSSEIGHKRYSELASTALYSQMPRTSARVGFVCDSLEEATESIRKVIEFLNSDQAPGFWEHPDGIYYRRTGIDTQGKKIVALFSGQGSQYTEMGKALLSLFPFIAQAYDYMDGLLTRDGLIPISTIVYPHVDMEKAERRRQGALLNRTEYTQPALGVFSACLYRILERLGLRPDFFAGQSFGELPALWAAKVLSDEDYYFLVKARGRAMATPHEDGSREGTMMAVNGDVEEITRTVEGFRDVYVEAWNSRTQIVLSGIKERLQELQYVFQNMGYATFLLPVSGAFHSPFMETARTVFSRLVSPIGFNQPQTPVYSNTNAESYPPEPESIKKTFVEHIVKPVRFREEIDNLCDAGAYFFVEFGPRNIATSFVDNILKDKPHLAVALNPAMRRRAERADCHVRCDLEVEGQALMPCETVNLSCHGACLAGLPETLEHDLADIQLHIKRAGGEEAYSVSGQVKWRQGRLTGVEFSSAVDEHVLGEILGENGQRRPKASRVKDSDRQLREAVVQLIVAGLPLRTLDQVVNTSDSLLEFQLPDEVT